MENNLPADFCQSFFGIDFDSPKEAAATLNTIGLSALDVCEKDIAEMRASGSTEALVKRAIDVANLFRICTDAHAIRGALIADLLSDGNTREAVRERAGVLFYDACATAKEIFSKDSGILFMFEDALNHFHENPIRLHISPEKITCIRVGFECFMELMQREAIGAPVAPERVALANALAELVETDILREMNERSELN